MQKRWKVAFPFDLPESGLRDSVSAFLTSDNISRQTDFRPYRKLILPLPPSHYSLKLAALLCVSVFCSACSDDNPKPAGFGLSSEQAEQKTETQRRAASLSE